MLEVNTTYTNSTIPVQTEKNKEFQEPTSVFSTAKEDVVSWLNDEDKICTDGNDDGKLTFKDAATSFAKGMAGIVKSVVKHPIATGAAIAVGAGLTVATGGAILPAMVALGATAGVAQVGVGTYKAITAETDGEAKQAFETMGNGTFGIAASALGAKSSLNTAKIAGVKSAATSENSNVLTSLIQCFKATPEALKVSATNVKGNIATLATSTIAKGSNKLQGGTQGVSKATTADVKKIDLSGTTEEILDNYKDSGMFYKDGKYYLPNKWNPDEPYLATDGAVLMKYGDDDFAVCASNIFDKSYGTTESFTSGNFEYASSTDLSPKEYINATKQAKSSFVEVAEGTKVQTLEGVRTVGADDVVAIDVEGNPYVQPKATFMKKNVVSGTVEANSVSSMAIKGGLFGEIDSALLEE